MSESERILREIECKIIDRHHLNYPLLQRNVNDVILALLRCYGDIVRSLRNGSIPKDGDDARHQTANKGFRGLPHCIRWVQSQCPRLIFVPSPGEQQLSEEALELLRWGVEYDPLYNQHTAYSRRINGQRFVEAEVDKGNKTITFLPCENIDPLFFISQIEAKKADGNRQASSDLDQELAERSKAWFQSANVGQDGILRFDDKTIASSGVLDAAIEWLQGSCLPELNDSDQLGNFSAGDLRRVLAAFHISSLFCTKFEDDSDQRTKNHNGILTHVLSWRICKLIDWLHEITSVDQCKLKSMLPIFIFDGEPERVTVAHKPLILGADNRVFLSPRIFLMLPLSEMVVGALNLNTDGKGSYDSISNSIEKGVVRKLTDEIHREFPQGSQIVSERTFTLSNDRTITPDILLLSADQSELLVIDVKNATPPFGVGDIANDLKT